MLVMFIFACTSHNWFIMHLYSLIAPFGKVVSCHYVPSLLKKKSHFLFSPSSSAGGKVQESYCYQIFLDQNHNLVLPTVQQLLEHSFHSAGLKLAEVGAVTFHVLYC